MQNKLLFFFSLKRVVLVVCNQSAIRFSAKIETKAKRNQSEEEKFQIYQIVWFDWLRSSLRSKLSIDVVDVSIDWNIFFDDFDLFLVGKRKFILSFTIDFYPNWIWLYCFHWIVSSTFHQGEIQYNEKRRCFSSEESEAPFSETQVYSIRLSKSKKENKKKKCSKALLRKRFVLFALKRWWIDCRDTDHLASKRSLSS